MDSIINTKQDEYELSSYFQHNGINQRIRDIFHIQVKNEGTKNVEIYYPYFDGSIKICRPFLENKWSFITSNSDEDKPRVFGIDKIPKKGGIVVIAAGEKDTLAFGSIGIPAISFGSESAGFDLRVIKLLKTNFDEVVIFFDRDETGLKKADSFSKEFEIPFAILPNGNFGKDITDFLSSGASKEDVEKIMLRSISKYYRKVTSYRAGMLQKMKFTEFDYIIPQILPADSLCALTGGSDSGKSLLLTQLAISYILEKDFLGCGINGAKKVLYFSLEDSPGSIAGRFEKLTSKLTKKELETVNENLFFKHQKDQIDKQIVEHMNSYPDTGIVIIDTFSEIAAGYDINNAGDVREILFPFHQIRLQYELTIIFIHHLGKSPDRDKKMNKNGIVGSQSFEAAMRVVFQMNKSENVFELGITKGNDIIESKKAPKSKITLTHDPKTLWFSKGLEIKTVQLSKSANQVQTVNWKEIFNGQKELRYSEIKESLLQSGLTVTPAENRIKNELEGFKVSKGLYRNPTIPATEPEEEEEFEL